MPPVPTPRPEPQMGLGGWTFPATRRPEVATRGTGDTSGRPVSVAFGAAGSALPPGLANDGFQRSGRLGTHAGAQAFNATGFADGVSASRLVKEAAPATLSTAGLCSRVATRRVSSDTKLSSSRILNCRASSLTLSCIFWLRVPGGNKGLVRSTSDVPFIFSGIAAFLLVGGNCGV